MTVMSAKGILQLDGVAHELEWTMIDLERNHSLLRISRNEIMGRTFGLFQKRSLVFCAKAKDCPGLANAGEEFVDLLRISSPVRSEGVAVARYYPPLLAMQLRSLAEARKIHGRAQPRPEVDRLAPQGQRVELYITLYPVPS